MSTKEPDGQKSKPKFQEGERILCFHGPLIYEAKCLKVRKNAEGIHEYLVHYSGWSKNWDEWTTDLRILKYNEQNLTKQRELLKAHKDAKKIRSKALLAASSSGGVGSAPNNGNSSESNTSVSKNSDGCPTDEDSGLSTLSIEEKMKTNGVESTDADNEDGNEASKKRKLGDDDFGVESEEHFIDKVEIEIRIADELKPWLVDDWDSICRQKKLLNLPAKTTVDEIIDNYIKLKSSSKNNSSANRESAAVQTANGIKEYFNATLGSQLLYKFERVQYSDILKKFPDKDMSSIYGAPHLLRLFVILGSLIVYTPISEKTVQILKTQLQDFLRYLQKNISSLFCLQNYEYASAEYQRQAS